MLQSSELVSDGHVMEIISTSPQSTLELIYEKNGWFSISICHPDCYQGKLSVCDETLSTQTGTCARISGWHCLHFPSCLLLRHLESLWQHICISRIIPGFILHTLQQRDFAAVHVPDWSACCQDPPPVESGTLWPGESDKRGKES